LLKVVNVIGVQGSIPSLQGVGNHDPFTFRYSGMFSG